LAYACPLDAHSWANKGAYNVKTISSIAADRAFKAISMFSGLGLALSFCLMAAGMDLSTTWL